jgi:hypothetical protein
MRAETQRAHLHDSGLVNGLPVPQHRAEDRERADIVSTDLWLNITISIDCTCHEL